ncbi:MAG: glycosyltransferase family 2 protein [Candidatus Hydrogenedentes bacterium]|nr:glycosyltransferase family 2 protein [Candidatus Hydrogenedentota bacterium]
MNPPLVYILVINWNGREHLEACLDSLLASDWPNSRVLLIDNASTDGSVTFAEERFGADPRLEILSCPRNLGWSGGNNAGIHWALEHGAEYLFLLNNDTATAPGAVRALVEMAEVHPEAGALAPKMVLFDAPRILNSVGLECSVIGASWDRGVGRHDTGAWDSPVEVIGACGGALFLRRTAVERAGLLPEDFLIYLDDLDLCLRILNAGYKILTCPQAVVRHKFSASFGTGRRARFKYYLNTRNRFWLLLRNFPGDRLAEILPAVALGEVRALGRAVSEGALWRVWAHVRAWGAALAYVPKARRDRHCRRAAGVGECRFWPMVLKRPYFCRGVELPDQGFYAERKLQGRQVRPMAQRAWKAFSAGRLRVVLRNCYPALGTATVRLKVAGVEAGSLSTLDETSVDLVLPEGSVVEFESDKLFFVEDTGELMDIGGWVEVSISPLAI